MDYGFIIPNSNESFVEFDLQTILDSIDLSSAEVLTNTKRTDFLLKLSKNEAFFCSREGISFDTKIALAILGSNDRVLSRMLHPYDIELNEAGEARMLLLIRNVVKKLASKLEEINGLKKTSPSFDVLKLLINDMVDLLLHVLNEK